MQRHSRCRFHSGAVNGNCHIHTLCVDEAATYVTYVMHISRHRTLLVTVHDSDGINKSDNQAEAKSDGKALSLETTPIPHLALALSLPAMVAQSANAFYTIFDRLLISRIPHAGDAAVAGIGICTPITIIIGAFAMFISSGGAPLASIELGKHRRDQAERILGICTTMTVCIALALMVVIFIFRRPILFMCGATAASYPFASTFLSVYLLGTLPTQVTLGLNNFISAQGKSKDSMVTTLIGVVVSLVLDPLFIFVFHWGIAGSAAANVIAQTCSAIWVVLFLNSNQSMMRIRRSHLCETTYIGRILALGLSPFVMQFTECLINVAFNVQLKRYGGDDYITAMTIITSCIQLLNIFSTGITQGVQPIISYNYGARKFDRVKSAYRLCFISYIIVVSLVVLAMSLKARDLAGLFTSTASIKDIVGRMLPIFICGMGIFGLQNGTQCTLMGLGQAKPSLFLAVLRKIILLIPLAIILPHFIGVIGVFVAEPVSDITAALCATLVFHLVVPRLLEMKA